MAVVRILKSFLKQEVMICILRDVCGLIDIDTLFDKQQLNNVKSEDLVLGAQKNAEGDVATALFKGFSTLGAGWSNDCSTWGYLFFET